MWKLAIVLHRVLILLTYQTVVKRLRVYLHVRVIKPIYIITHYNIVYRSFPLRRGPILWRAISTVTSSTP